MTLPRLIALCLLVTASAAFGLTSQEWFYSALLCGLGLAGLRGRLQFKIAPSRRFLVMFLLSTIFALKHRFAPFDNEVVKGFIEYPFAYVVAQYFLALIVLQFYLPTKNGLPIWILLAGVVVLICSGDVLLSDKQESIYFLIVSLYAILAVLYCGVSTHSTGQHPNTRQGLRRIIAGILLLAGIPLGLTVSNMLFRHQKEANLLLQMLDPFWSRSKTKSIGFSNETGLTNMAKIKQADANIPALHVLSDQVPGYLRAKVYETYAKSSWKSVENTRTISPTAMPVENPKLPGEGNLFIVRNPKGSQWVMMNIWPAPHIRNGMFTPAETTLVKTSADTLTVDKNGAIDSPDLDIGVNYQAAAPRDVASEPTSPNPGPAYLGVPETLDSRIRDLAIRLFKDCNTTRQKINAVEQYFIRNYNYQLGIHIPSNQDPLTYFLIEKPAAHCEYFATGAAILLRLGGVPTRYVTGFVAQERSPYGNCWIARNKDAHAWVEAWDGDQHRWVWVEATPSSGIPSGESPGMLRSLWDYINFQLQEWRVTIQLQGVWGLLKLLGAGILGLVRFLFATIPGLVITAILAAIILRKFIRRLINRRRLPKPDPFVATLHALLRIVDDKLKKVALIRQPNETLDRYANRLLHHEPADTIIQQAAEWYVLYSQIRYSGRTDEECLVHLRNKIPKT